MGGFAIDIGKFAQKFGVNANAAARKIIFDIQKDTIIATPVLNGFLRSNWFVGIGAPPDTSNPTLSDSGASSQAKALATLGGFKWGNTVYLTNNLPYANFIEFGGSTVKAPAGMLRVTVARFEAHFGRWS